MTKQAVIAIVVAVLIILGAAGAFLYAQTRSSNENSDTKTASETGDSKNDKAQSSITDILTSGKNSKCTFSVGEEDNQTTGIVYTSGQNARGDFQTSADGEETITHMIRNGDDFYMWGDSIATGIKMVMSVDELASRMQGNNFNSINPDQPMDVDCVTWTQDATLFSPPTSVKFTSINAFIPTGVVRQTTGAPTGPASGPSGGPNECNICNSLTGNAKSTCLQQFDCN